MRTFTAVVALLLTAVLSQCCAAQEYLIVRKGDTVRLYFVAADLSMTELPARILELSAPSPAPPTVPPPTPSIPVPIPVPPTDPTVPPAPGPRLAVIVYESSETQLPLSIHEARRKLESLGHQVRIVDRDVTTGTGAVPREVAAALAAAKDRAGISLIVSSGERILKVVDLPRTSDSIVGEVIN